MVRFMLPGLTLAALAACGDGAGPGGTTALSIKLTSEEIAELEEPYVPHAVAGFA